MVRAQKGRLLAYLVDGRDGMHILDVTDPANLINLSTLNLEGFARGVDIVAGEDGKTVTAFVAAGDKGIRVVDVSEPSQPHETASFPVKGYAERVKVIESGSGKSLRRIAYVAAGKAGLRIFDVSDLPNASEIGSIDTSGYTESVVVDGEHSYLADGVGGLRVIDIRNLDKLKEVGQFKVNGNLHDILIEGNIAYLAYGRAGMQIIDLNDPLKPEKKSAFDTSGDVMSISIAGAYAYIADRGRGLQVVDIVDPAHPIEVGRIDQGSNKPWPEDAQGVQVVGDTAYVADGNDGLRAYSTQINVKLDEVSSSGKPQVAIQVAVSDPYAYIAGGRDGLRILNISKPEDPRPVGATGLEGNALAVAVKGDYAFVAAGDKGLRVVSVFDPKNPTEVGQWDTLGDARSLALYKDYVLLADGAHGLQVIDVSNPQKPGKIGEAALAGETNGVVVSGNYAYIANGSVGLAIFDISDARHPASVGLLREDSAQRVALSGNLAFVACGGRGLRIVDVANPKSPQEIGSFAPDPGDPFTIMDVAVSGGQAYLADGQGSLRVLDLSDPKKPKEIPEKRVEFPGPALSVTASNDIVFVADNENGVRILEQKGEKFAEISSDGAPVDVRDVTSSGDYTFAVDSRHGMWVLEPWTPDQGNRTRLRPVGFLLLPADLRRVVVSDPYAYVLGGSKVFIVDISDPQNPQKTGEFDTGAEARGMAITDYGTKKEPKPAALVAAAQKGVQVWDLSNPAQPQLLSTYDTPKDATDIVLSGSYAFIADGNYGLRVANIADPNNISVVSLLDSLGFVQTVYTSGDIAYVGGSQSMTEVNISDPTRLQPVAQVDTGSVVHRIDLIRAYAYLATASNGVQVAYVINPGQPVLVGKLPSNGLSLGLATRGRTDKPQIDMVYVADGPGNLRAVEAEKAASLAELGAYETDGQASILTVLRDYRRIGSALISRQLGQVPLKERRTLTVIFFDLLVFLAGLLIWIGLVAPFVLPVESLNHWGQSFARLVFYLVGMHGPAVVVRDGKIVEHVGEQKRRGFGVVLVDASSAVILERRGQAYFFLLNLVLAPLNSLYRSLSKALGLKQAGREAPRLKAIGPGLHFTEYRYFPNYPRYDFGVHSAVDLRPQIRIRPEVMGMTRDGIEVSTAVYIGFTIGQPSELLKVTYFESAAADNLRVITLEEKRYPEPAGKIRRSFVVTFQPAGDLDSSDREEIHRTVKVHKAQVPMVPAKPVVASVQTKRNAPYHFDEQRVFLAAYSQALDVQEDLPKEWTELPAHVAAGVFRNLIAQEVYDHLYEPNDQDPKNLPLKNLKKEFLLAIRNLGVLAYQFVERKDGQPLKNKQEVAEDDLIYFPVQELRTPKVLRARGIKVNFAGFSELKPILQDKITGQRVDTWSSYWQKTATLTQAEYDYQVKGLLSKARAMAQEEMLLSIAKLFENTMYTREALALHIYQALESAASDPTTRRLLPQETIQMLHLIHSWFNPGEEEPTLPSGPRLPPPEAPPTLP